MAPDGRKYDGKRRMEARLKRFHWLASDRFERVFFVFITHRFEAPKLSMGNRFCNDHAAEEEICPFDRVRTDFDSFSE